MRYLIFSLVSINFLYFVLAHYPKEIKPQILPALEGEQIALLDELKHVDTNLQQISKTPKEKFSHKNACTLIGPFRSILTQNYVNQMLNNYALSANELFLPKKNNLYGIYLVSEDIKDISQVVYQLRLKGIDATNSDNGILLGKFINPNDARAFAQYILTLGFNTKILEDNPNEQWYWLQIHTDYDKFPQELLVEIKKNFFSISKYASECQA